jgi:tubulin monoglycylase TTLL3/8
MRGKRKCFEIFGYDFMVDDLLNVWLIEINSSPAMDHSTQITANLVLQFIIIGS